MSAEETLPVPAPQVEDHEADERVDPVELTAPVSQLILIDEIHELENVRPDLPAIDEIASSIALHGIMHPVVVRRAPQDAEHGKAYELVMGYRRKAGAETLGHDKIPATIRDLDDQTLLEEMISENTSREDLEPLAEARAMKRLKDTFGLTNDQIARRLSCHRTQVGKRLALLELPQQVRGLLSEGKITASHAEVIARMDSPQEQEEVAELAVRTKAPVERLSSYVTNIKKKQEQEQVEHEGSEPSERQAQLPAPVVDDPDVPVSAATIYNVTPMPRLSLRDDLTADDETRMRCYALLRAGNDVEIVEHLETVMQVLRDDWWTWLKSLSGEEAVELERRLTRRWFEAAHRYPTFPEDLAEDLADGDITEADRDEFDLPDGEEDFSGDGDWSDPF